MKRYSLEFIGQSPILLSCDILADPINEATIQHKSLTGKKQKTLEDHEMIARSQWEAALYWDSKVGVILPTQNIKRAIIDGAQINKKGMQIKRGVHFLDDFVPIDYGEKLSIDKLWKNKSHVDRRSVVVSRSRVMAYRPKFINWRIVFDLDFDDTMLDASHILQACQNAGNYVGIGGYRPEKGGKFGRFKVISGNIVDVPE